MKTKTIQEFESRELWLDFETWWNKYIEYSKSYNNERKNA